MDIKNVINELEQATGPVVKVFQKGENFKVLILGFKTHMKLADHKTPIRARLLVLKGKVVYREGLQSFFLSQFEDQEIPVNVIHSVEALEDSICLLIQG